MVSARNPHVSGGSRVFLCVCVCRQLWGAHWDFVSLFRRHCPGPLQGEMLVFQNATEGPRQCRGVPCIGPLGRVRHRAGRALPLATWWHSSGLCSG